MSDATTSTSSVPATDETSDLIASNKVEGTAVYDSDGERLGTVYNFMVNKRSGQVAYAVMSFGGFLGIGESYHPLPWKALTYDTRQSGYVVEVSRERSRERRAIRLRRCRTGLTRAIGGALTNIGPRAPAFRSSFRNGGGNGPARAEPGIARAILRVWSAGTPAAATWARVRGLVRSFRAR